MNKIKDILKKGLIGVAIINLALFYSVVGLANRAQAADAEIIIDDGDTGFTSSFVNNSESIDTWSRMINSSGWETDFLYETSDSLTTKWAKWTPNISEPGLYNVYAHWSAHPDGATNTQYQINYSGGVDYQTVDQTKTAAGVSSCFYSASGWKYLGSYQFAEGSTGFVKLLESAQGNTIADSVKFSHTNVVPSVPKLLSPGDKAYLNDLKPTFEWDLSIDIDDTNIEYELEVDDNLDFSSLVIDEKNLLNTKFTPTSDLLKKTHYWRVRSFDGEDYSEWSQMRILNFDMDDPLVNIDSYTPAINERTVFKEGRKEKIDLKSTIIDSLSGLASTRWEFEGNVILRTEDGISEYIYVDNPGEYDLVLKAKDNAGNRTEEKVKLTFQNQLPVVPSLSIIREEDGIKLGWNRVDDTRGYQIIKNGIPIQAKNDLIPADVTEYLDEYVREGNSYEYRVRAYDQDSGYQDIYVKSNPVKTYLFTPKAEQLVSTSSVGGSAVTGDPFSTNRGEVKSQKKDNGKVEENSDNEDAIDETGEEAKTNWPMIIAIIIAATIVLGGAAYWWYGVSEDKDQI